MHYLPKMRQFFDLGHLASEAWAVVLDSAVKFSTEDPFSSKMETSQIEMLRE